MGNTLIYSKLYYNSYVKHYIEQEKLYPTSIVIFIRKIKTSVYTKSH